jgi:hypothetical protein
MTELALMVTKGYGLAPAGLLILALVPVALAGAMIAKKEIVDSSGPDGIFAGRLSGTGDRR